MNLYFDIGANKGLYTKKLFETKTVDRVICVEANPNIIDTLKQNLAEHSSKIEIVNKAVSSVKGEVDFYVCQADEISTCDLSWKDESRFSEKTNPNSRCAVPTSSWSKIKVETISLDQLIEKYGIPLEIKIDVEGYELNAIKSMKKFYHCPLSFEWAEEKLSEIKESINYLYDLGYREFSFQYKDRYDYRPKEYKNKENFIKTLDEICVVGRYEKWGMIYCR